MRICVSGKQDGKARTYTYDLLDRNDRVAGLSSMSRTTGYTCTASLQMIMDGLFTQKGVFPPELVGGDEKCFAFLMQYLADRNVHYKLTES
jgi:saccharopine dehydrogenase-like NADP-dependent oxidoreductase